MNSVTILVSVCTLALFTGTSTAQTSCSNIYGAPPGGCSSSECVIYDLTSQAVCTEVLNRPPTYNALWKQGLNVNVDRTILEGRIAAYKIQWFNGQWSQWFVPGVNDIDTKVTGCAMRRFWSFFFDHTHSYIICN